MKAIICFTILCVSMGMNNDSHSLSKLQSSIKVCKLSEKGKILIKPLSLERYVESYLIEEIEGGLSNLSIAKIENGSYYLTAVEEKKGKIFAFKLTKMGNLLLLISKRIYHSCKSSQMIFSEFKIKDKEICGCNTGQHAFGQGDLFKY